MRPEAAPPAVSSAAPERHGHLRLSVRTYEQLFNSFDPSPFYEKDLDAAAENFLVSWARELHPRADLRLTLYVKTPPAEPHPERWLVEAIHHNFAERARLARAELHALLRVGRISFLVGVTFLALCLLSAQLIARAADGVLPHLFEEGLLIAGWVAMWRPLQIALYDWWPLLQKQRLYRRMSRMPVELRVGAA